MFETAEQVRVAVRELTDAVWVLSAMATVLSDGVEEPFSMDDPTAPVRPAPRAIELAAATVAGHGLAGRVQLRCQGVEELTDEELVVLSAAPGSRSCPDASG